MDTSRQEYDKIIKKLDQFIEILNSERSNKKNLSTEINNYIEKYSAICTTYIGDNQETLLMIVARKNINDITKLVTKKILDFKLEALRLSDNQGNTPLLHAAMANNTEFLEIIAIFLLSDEIKIKNNANKTAFMLAAQNNHKVFLEKMLELKFNISSEEKEQSLLLAAEYGHTAVVEFFLSKGVNPFIKDTQGNTPLIVAHKKGHYEVVSLLRKQSPVSRQIFTWICFSIFIEELAQGYSEGIIKKISKVSGCLLKNVMYYLHIIANIKQSKTFILSKTLNKIDAIIPHFIEPLLLKAEREKYVIKLLYGESDNPSESSVEAHQESINAVTAELENDQTTPIRRYRRNQIQSPGTPPSSVQNNDSEHCIQQPLEITEQAQENFSDSRQFSETSNPDDNIHLEIIEAEANLEMAQGELLIKQAKAKKIAVEMEKNKGRPDSSMHRETPSTMRSPGALLSRTPVPKLILPKLNHEVSRPRNPTRLPSEVAAFLTDESASASVVHQDRPLIGNESINFHNTRQHGQ